MQWYDKKLIFRFVKTHIEKKSDYNSALILKRDRKKEL